MKNTTTNVSTDQPRCMRRRKTSVSKKRWLSYAAAGAATVAAGHESAEAAITYVDPADILVKAPLGGTGTNSTAVPIDLDNDGQNDFDFFHVGTATSGNIGAASVVPISNTHGNNNMVAGFLAGAYPYAYNLPASGSSVSASSPSFLPAAASMAFGAGYSNSQFLGAGPGILGVKFDSAAGTHYGWVRVDMAGAPENSYHVTDWAYGMPGEAVHVGAVPEPGSLGLLACGAAGLLAWRRKRAAA